jgi:dolichol-phosphate mannosyltransferase
MGGADRSVNAPGSSSDTSLRTSAPSRDPDAAVDLSVIIPALNDSADLVLVLPELHRVLEALAVSYQLLVVTADATAGSRSAVAAARGEILVPAAEGYGGALITGFAAARGEYILTMDADTSHPPVFVEQLWNHREDAEVTIASRYVPGAVARMPRRRYVLSRALNAFFGRGLDVPIRDLSSGFRLYKAAVLRQQTLTAHDFDILQQIVVRAYADGWKVQEIPFTYEPREHGSSQRRVWRVGLACLRTFWDLWKLRNSILAADYDDRAHDSRIYLQRYWQRSRHRHVTDLIAGEGRVLDVGCGSSRIIAALPPGSVAVDILLRKLRYARKFGRPLVHASGFSLPFRDNSFPCVLCSQVIEHVPKESPILDELCRVLAPGGRLVLGTPDYDHWEWVATERLYGMVPGGYADEHIAHYSLDELKGIFERRGFSFEGERYILRGELIMAVRKPR